MKINLIACDSATRNRRRRTRLSAKSSAIPSAFLVRPRTNTGKKNVSWSVVSRKSGKGNSV